ncbi:MAG: hypothetical protein KAI47_23195 [Deltaproteobacteria bacterium]|nr:hypothetical protein [Deltaproteobacteria bacterium]
MTRLSWGPTGGRVKRAKFGWRSSLAGGLEVLDEFQGKMLESKRMRCLKKSRRSRLGEMPIPMMLLGAMIVMNLAACVRFGFNADLPTRDTETGDAGFVEAGRRDAADGTARPDMVDGTARPDVVDGMARLDGGGDLGSDAGVPGPAAFQWAKPLPSNVSGAGFAVAVDSKGNSYVAGFFTGTIDLGGGKVSSKGDWDVFLTSFTALGAHRWQKTFGGTGDDEGFGVAVDPSGRVYVAGIFSGTAGLGGGEREFKGGLGYLCNELCRFRCASMAKDSERSWKCPGL